MSEIECRRDAVPALTPLFANRWHFLSLVAIVLGSCSLALYWVFLVPIYQAPDEPMNLDYALAINEHGGLFRVPGASFDSLPRLVHPYSTYLAQKTETGRIIFQAAQKMAPEYGTAEFYAKLEREAPSRGDLRIDTPNGPYAVYPFGYYGLLALWIELLHVHGDGPVFIFFGSRCLSVVLLFFSLCLTHATLRHLEYGAMFSLFLTAVIGFFPLTSFVASAIQMDNLSFTLVSLCFYASARLKREPRNPRLLALLGLAFGGLLITKLHFLLCVSVPILSMLATRVNLRSLSWARILTLVCLLAIPSSITGAVYLWSNWGTTNFYAPPAEYVDPWLHGTQWFKKAILDFYGDTTHLSFWGVFGWLDAQLYVREPWLNELVWFALQASSWLFLGLTLLRLEQVASRLLKVARRGRVRYALRVACSNPLINSYFLFTVFMVWLYIRLDNRFGAQGRNWWPLLLPIFLTGLTYAPRALSLRRSSFLFSKAAGGLLLVFCILGSNYSLKTIKKRYYLPGQVRMALLEQQKAVSNQVENRVNDTTPPVTDAQNNEVNPARPHRKWLLSIP